MARLSRLVLMLGVVFGSSVAVPAKSHAGVIPWMYDAIFGPVGSIRANRVAYGYRPYSSYGMTSVGYAPMTVAYAPTTSYYAPYSNSGCACSQSAGYSSYGTTAYYSDYGYGNAGCSSCGSSGCSSCGGSGCSSCGSSGCSSCSSGNCSAGTSSMPVTSGYGPSSPSSVAPPTPDPNYNTQNVDVNSRIRELEYRIRELDHRQKEDEKFLDRKYEGQYKPSPYSSGSYNSGGTYNSGRSDGYNSGRMETVPQRRQDSFESDPMYTSPRKQRAPAQDPLEQENRKPELGAPTPAFERTNTKPNGADANDSNETEPQALNLDNRITSRAVAPRERMQIVTKESKLQTVAKSNKRNVKTSDNHSSTELARH